MVILSNNKYFIYNTHNTHGQDPNSNKSRNSVFARTVLPDVWLESE